MLSLRFDVAQAPCVSASSQKYLGSAESLNRSRRLNLLREQLVNENRRSAAPFSHPLASRGPLQPLCDQIRDVSRIADAIAISADSASEGRLLDLCSDLRRLLQTQQRWTERLENQIWRLETQGKLMRRLQQALQQGSPGTDQIWELCELIARETRAIPEGILLLPEPGHRISIVHDGASGFAARTIEKARLCVFAGISILPDVRGAELAAYTFLSCFRQQSESFPESPSSLPEADQQALFQLSTMIEKSSIERPLRSEGMRLVDVTKEFSEYIEEKALKASENLVPPAIREYYSALTRSWPSSQHQDEASQEIARSLCSALGLSEPADSVTKSCDDDEDEKLVLFHKLRCHEGHKSCESEGSVSLDDSSSVTEPSRVIRRPRFLPPASSSGASSRLRVFSDE
jgi:hypothetical protein